MSIDLKHTEGSFSPNLTDLLCLRVTQVPRSLKVVIFVLTTTMTTQLITLSLAHARRVVKMVTQPYNDYKTSSFCSHNGK